VPVAEGAASPLGFPATRAAGAAAWGALLPAGLLGAGSWGAAAAASAGACGTEVVMVVVASPASLMPPPVLSLGHLGGGWRRLVRLGLRLSEAGADHAARAKAAARVESRGGGSSSGSALALGLLARSYCPQNGPAQVFLGGAQAGEGRAGEGSGWGNLALTWASLISI
jgi:hypothetical protein